MLWSLGHAEDVKYISTVLVSRRTASRLTSTASAVSGYNQIIANMSLNLLYQPALNASAVPFGFDPLPGPDVSNCERYYS